MVEGTFLITPIWHAIRWTWHDPDGYNIISGPLADVTLLGGAYALYRHHNCHVQGCPRIGRHKVAGTEYVVCRRHHPDEAPSAERVLAEHRAAAETRQALHRATLSQSADAAAAMPGPPGSAPGAAAGRGGPPRATG